MGKYHEKNHDISAETFLDEVDYDLDDEAFFQQFQPKMKRTRSTGKKKRDARRRIEEYRENRELAKRLNDYHYHSDD